MIDRQLACAYSPGRTAALPLADQVIDAHGARSWPIPSTRPVSMAIFSLVPTHRSRPPDRVLKACGAQVEQGPEPAKRAHRAGPVGGAGGWLDPLDQRIARVDVHTRIGIGSVRSQPSISVLPPAHAPPLSQGGRDDQTRLHRPPAKGLPRSEGRRADALPGPGREAEPQDDPIKQNRPPRRPMIRGASSPMLPNAASSDLKLMPRASPASTVSSAVTIRTITRNRSHSPRTCPVPA